MDSQYIPIPRVTAEALPELRERQGAARTPFIVSGAIARWKALGWTLDNLKDAIGATPIDALVNLPSTGVPYFLDKKGHVEETTVGAFLDRIQATPDVPSYLPQLSTRKLPGIEGDFDFADLFGSEARIRSTGLWVGTKDSCSGLHFDRHDGFLTEVIGRKRALLGAPGDARGLYPVKDSVEKSAVDPLAPDLRAHPKFRAVRLHEGVLEPGDALFIPRLWWHYLRSLDTSVSLNEWRGEEATLRDLARVVSAGGIGHWLQLSRDFTFYGVLHRPFHQRLRSEVPTGKALYDIVAGGVRCRLPFG